MQRQFFLILYGINKFMNFLLSCVSFFLDEFRLNFITTLKFMSFHIYNSSLHLTNTGLSW